MTDIELAETIKAWIKAHTTRRKLNGRINDSKVWSTLKTELKLLGHWKDLPRGDKV